MDLNAIRDAIKRVADKLVTVRTGTVVSNLAPQNQTMVKLDNDDSGNSVAANCLNGPLPAGTRVSLLAYPPSGLLILGSFGTPTLPATQPWLVFTGGPHELARPTDPRLTYIEFEGSGGGGAGGGAAAAAAGQSSIGSGGAGGMWCQSVYRIQDLNWPLSVTGGAGGLANVGAAGDQGEESWVEDAVGTYLLRCPGGAGGGTLPSSATLLVALGALGANIATPFVGQRATFGGDGGSGARLVAAGPNIAGQGGSSYFGGGGRGGRNNVGESGGGGAPLGSGGGGSQTSAGQAAKAGGGGQIGAVYYRFY